MEEEIRKEAIERFTKGETPKSIYTDLHRSKKWFFKWLDRYQTGQGNWYLDQSKRPKSSPRRLSDIERQRILETRQRLETESFAQIGASAIKWELTKAGLSFPADRTINRVLAQEGLIKKKTLCSERS